MSRKTGNVSEADRALVARLTAEVKRSLGVRPDVVERAMQSIANNTCDTAGHVAVAAGRLADELSRRRRKSA